MFRREIDIVSFTIKVDAGPFQKYICLFGLSVYTAVEISMQTCPYSLSKQFRKKNSLAVMGLKESICWKHMLV